MRFITETKPRGCIVYNAFLTNARIDAQVALFSRAASERGLELPIVANDAFDCVLDGGFGLDQPPDFALFYDKDLHLAITLEALGVRLFNSAAAIALCDDKALTHIELCKIGCPMPKTIFAPKSYAPDGFTHYGFAVRAADELGFPLIVKRCRGSMGGQVGMVRNMDELLGILRGANGEDMLMQQFIPTRGDVRVNVVDGKPVAAMRRACKEGDFRSNIALGGTGTSHVPTAQEADLSVRCVAALGLDFAGADLILGENGPLVLEVNSNPQTMAAQECTGIDVTGQIVDAIIRQIKR